MPRSLLAPFTTALLALALAQPVTAAPDGVQERTLKNGLRVIVKEDHRAPTVAHMVWYKVGSVDEVDGTSGVAHALEHMMFKGTPKVGPGEFNRRVAAAGGRDNAFTSRDYTAYFQQVPAGKLPEMMSLEADRMRHLNLDAKEFAKEIQVVMEERRLRTEDQPAGTLYEQLNAVAWQAHPYRRPIIGWMDDLKNMTVRDLRDWYDRWYVPNNATLVVVGDVKASEVFKQAEATYGKLPGRALPPRKPQEEPRQIGQRRLTVKVPADLPTVTLAWPAPTIRSVDADNADSYALDMLAAVLDGHDAARLPTRLVKERRIAVSVDVGNDNTARGPGQFLITASPAPGHSVAELETALREEITRIAKDGVDEAELRRARAQMIAAQVYKRDSMFGQAMELGQWAVLGYPNDASERFVDALRKVTPADVQRVAARYFGDDTLTVAVLDPQPLPVEPKKRANIAVPHH